MLTTHILKITVSAYGGMCYLVSCRKARSSKNSYKLHNSRSTNSRASVATVYTV